jgi:hypothetical protein
MIAVRWFFAVLLVVGLAGTAAAADLATVKLSKEDDKVTVVSAKDEVVAQIASNTGIGKAEIHPVDKKWPAKLSIEIDVKGLEGHSISKGDILLQGDGQVFHRKGDEWVKADKLGKDYQPKITKGEGKYTIEIPAVWLKGPEPLKVEWIDFYRR